MELVDPRERVEVARCDELAPRTLRRRRQVEELRRRCVRVVDGHRPPADVVGVDGQADHRIGRAPEPRDRLVVEEDAGLAIGRGRRVGGGRHDRRAVEEHDFRGAGHRLLAVLVGDAELEGDGLQPARLLLARDARVRGQVVAEEVERAELTRVRRDVAPAGQPVVELVVRVRDAQVAHPEDVGLTGGLRRGTAHVHVDELVVDRGVAVPVREVRGALERRELVAGRDVVEHSRVPLFCSWLLVET